MQYPLSGRAWTDGDAQWTAGFISRFSVIADRATGDTLHGCERVQSNIQIVDIMTPSAPNNQKAKLENTLYCKNQYK